MLNWNRALNSSCVALALVTMASVAHAAPPRIRGTILNVTGDELTVQTRAGAKAVVKLAANYRVSGVEKAALSDIKTGGFVGATTVPEKNGALRALEIHIFPAAARGTGEGSRPWDLAPQSMMTNADVSGSVTNSQGRELTLTYKGGEKKVLVTPRTPVVLIAPATQADVKPGVGIVVAPTRQDPDGAYEADRISIGLNGAVPPQ